MNEHDDPRHHPGQREHFHDIVEANGFDNLPEPIQDLLQKDTPLSNIDSDDRRYLRLLSENIVHYSEEMHPPEQSLIQGDVGAALLEDPDYDMHALDDEQRAEMESALLTHFTRLARAENGWQQDKLNEGISTKRIEDKREEGGGGSDGGRGGILGRIF